MPITQILRALACDFTGLGRLPSRRTTMGRINHTNVALGITHQNRLGRVAKAVAVTGLHQRKLRLHRIQKSGTSGSFAAVIRQLK